MIDQAGHRTWRACEDVCLQEDYDGVYGFCIGIRTENFSMMYLQFTIEEFDEKSLELRIKN
jgi:hypothetical protein